MHVSSCPRDSSQGTRNARAAAERQLPSSEGAHILLQPMLSLCSREIPARLHFTFLFRRFGRPTANKQDGQLCKPLEGNGQAPPRRQRAWQSQWQPVTSAPVSAGTSACPCEASEPGQGSASRRCEEGRSVWEQGRTPASWHRRAGLVVEHRPAPWLVSIKLRSCLPDVCTAGGVPGHTTIRQRCPTAFGAGCWGLEGLGRGDPKWTPLCWHRLPPTLGSSPGCFTLAHELCPCAPRSSQNSGASMRMGFIALPTPAKSWARSANCNIPQEPGKGCYKAGIKHFCCDRKWKIIR